MLQLYCNIIGYVDIWSLFNAAVEMKLKQIFLSYTECIKWNSTQNKINFFCKVVNFPTHQHGPLWSWTYGSWIYNYLCNQCLSQVHGEVYSIQHYVIKFISDLQQIGGFLRVLFGFLHQYNCRHDIAEILLKVALNTINQTKSTQFFK